MTATLKTTIIQEPSSATAASVADGAWRHAVGTGGSGIVIIRYANATQRATGGTVVNSGGYWYHTFTGNGTFAA